MLVINKKNIQRLGGKYGCLRTSQDLIQRFYNGRCVFCTLMSIIYCDEHWSPYKVKAHLCFFLNVSSRSIQRMLLFKTKLFIIFTFTTKSRNLKRDVSMMTGSRSGDLKKRKFIPFYPFTSFQSSSFVLYVCPSIHPSVRMELLGFHWMGFHEI